jgi:hypothetical protein
MKLIKYIFIILPVFISAQEVDKAAIFTGNYDWYVKDVEGCVMAIGSDAINFEEQWMRFSPTGVPFMSRDNTQLSMAYLRAPFWAEVSYYKQGSFIYIASVRFLKQFRYDGTGQIMSEEFE